MTHNAATTVHQVISAIAAPMGPKPSHPLSSIGNSTRVITRMSAMSRITPATPHQARCFHPLAPLRTSSAGVADQSRNDGSSPSRLNTM